MALEFSRYDQRRYEIVDVTSGYGAWSGIYDDPRIDDLDIALFERMTCVDWASIPCAVDLACGTGRIGAWLAARGVAAIDGVDVTPEMLALADDKRVYRQLFNQDIRHVSLPDGGAELVTCSMAIGHLPELDPVCGEVDRLLAAGGLYAMVGYHPFFLLAGIPTHFKDEAGKQTAIQNYIHLMSDHVTAGRARGWNLIEMHERVVDDDWVSRAPNYARHLGKPVTFAMVWRKP